MRGRRPATRPDIERERGELMAGRVKERVTLRLIETGEIVGEGELTQARARAIIKAYALAGLLVEAEAC